MVFVRRGSGTGYRSIVFKIYLLVEWAVANVDAKFILKVSLPELKKTHDASAVALTNPSKPFERLQRGRQSHSPGNPRWQPTLEKLRLALYPVIQRWGAPRIGSISAAHARGVPKSTRKHRHQKLWPSSLSLQTDDDAYVDCGRLGEELRSLCRNPECTDEKIYLGGPVVILGLCDSGLLCSPGQTALREWAVDLGPQFYTLRSGCAPVVSPTHTHTHNVNPSRLPKKG